MEYEINFLVLQSSTETVEQIKDKVKALIKEYKGSVIDELVYKKRKLAYEIKHEAYGFFTVLRFNLEDKAEILELKRELNLVQEIARYLIVRADELPTLSKEVLTMEKRERTTVKQEDVEKILAKSDQRKVAAKKEVVKEEAKKETEKLTVKEKEVGKKTEEVGKENDSDEKSSLEDLDKKLDEILSI